MPGRRRLSASGVVLLLCVLAACGGESDLPDAVDDGCPQPPPAPSVAAAPSGSSVTGGTPELLVARTVTSLPHDETAFTQGLAYAGGDELYEGTGMTSDIRRVRIADGEVVTSQPLEPPLFGEGVALTGDRLVQLTWLDGVAFVRDRCDLTEQRQIRYEGEGWGLTYDGELLWRSDGSHVLRGLDPQTLDVVEELAVTDRGVPVRMLNELEVVDGALLANVWQTDWVARIDLATGRVTGWIDGSGLAAGQRPADPDAVLNGIAWDSAGDRLWMTGKLWPVLLEVVLDPAGGPPPPPGLGGT